MKINGHNIKIIGHRGMAGLEPENTLLSIKKSVELGCEMVEVDARLSSDGKIVLLHDKTLNRTTDGKGPVSKKTLEELKKLNAGKEEKIPTLEEAWDLIKRKKAGLNIEIKEKRALKKVLFFIKKNKAYKQVLLSSKYLDVLKNAKKTNPSIKVALISSIPFNLINNALKVNAEAINPLANVVNKILINKAHKNNLKVYPFPNGTAKENIKTVKKIIEKDIDGIFLNDPTILKSLV